MVEQLAVNQLVVGSSPTLGALGFFYLPLMPQLAFIFGCRLAL